MEHIIRALILLIILSIVPSCATKKKRRDETSKLGKFYHNTTAKFNGYYNANVLYNESLAKLSDQHQDNYNKLLPMFPYMAAPNGKAVAEDLDEAIKKVSVVVALHRPSHWTDDCYLLMAKSQYVKREFEDAEETLEFFKEEFDPINVAAGKSNAAKIKNSKTRAKAKAQRQKEMKNKRKVAKKEKKQRAKERKKRNKEIKKKRKRAKKQRAKDRKKRQKGKKVAKTPKKETSKSETEKSLAEEEKEGEDAEKKPEKPEEPDNNFLKHRPVYQDGLMWLARTYIERDNFFEAELLLNQLDRDPMTFEEIKGELAAIRAYFYIKQKEYPQSIDPLIRAIDLSEDKEQKARFSYILAQIYQMQNQPEAAVAAFEQALKYTNFYEMEFSSKLNLIRNSWERKEIDSEEAIKRLTRMTKDIKNEEYRDQLYFAMANMALTDNEKITAIDFFKKSVLYSTSNVNQKAESYYSLGELYFESQNYVNAKLYYDSTLTLFNRQDERYQQVQRTRDNLTGIAESIMLIQEQDSLLRLAKMDPQQRKEMAYQIKKEQDEARLNEAKQNAQSGDKPQANTRRRGPAVTSSFFAYDDKSVKKGRKEFSKIWGDRKLEDDWRRSNKRSDGDLLIDEIPEERLALELTDAEVDEILKDVPTDDAAIKAANKKIEDAYFKLGQLYRDRLENNRRSVEAMEELLRRYPDTEHQLEAWYFLYLAHTDLQNRPQAKIYYDKIVSTHPESTYARALKDPNFLEKSKEEEQRIARYYDETYELFKKGDYQQTLDRAAKVGELFGPTGSMGIHAKFALLSAMSVGNTKGKTAYVEALKDVASRYPKTDEEKRAKEILRLLNSSAGAGSKSSDGKSTAGRYKVDDKSIHYFIVVLKGEAIGLTDAKNAVSNYNLKFHKLDRLRISNIYLDAAATTPVLVIRRFKGKEDAMDYYDGIVKNRSEFLPADAEFDIYPLTQYNYRTVLKNKSLDGYQLFFEDTYLD